MSYRLLLIVSVGNRSAKCVVRCLAGGWRLAAGAAGYEESDSKTKTFLSHLQTPFVESFRVNADA